jgi:hypothetical protein
MSITPSSTSLGTAWTEQTLGGQFTAGTLAAIANLVAEVEARLQRGTLGAATVPTETQVQNWLVSAKQELAESKGYTFARRYAYCTVVAGTYRYGMPPDYNGGPISVKNTTSSSVSRPIDIWPEHAFNLRYPRPADESNDEPMIGCIKNMELWLIPPPDYAYTLEMEYQRSGADGTATEFDWLPEIERWRCCDFATYRAFAMLQQWQAAQLYRQEWQVAVAKSKKADAKRKWVGDAQALSVFQVGMVRKTPEGGH